MTKDLTQAQQTERAAKKATHKANNVKITRFKYTMEIIRTGCAILAVTLNILVLTHILGFWKSAV